MDDVVSILVVVAAIALAACQNYAKKKKTKNTVSRRKTAKPIPPVGRKGEIVPDKGSDSVAQYVDNKKNRKVKGENKKRREVAVEPQKKPSPRIAQPAVSEKNIRLSTPEEARRAFIYSEIFNRKY